MAKNLSYFVFYLFPKSWSIFKTRDIFKFVGPDIFKTQPKLGQIAHVGVGGFLIMSGPADFKYVHGFENWTRFGGVIEQNKIWQTFGHHCINLKTKLFNVNCRKEFWVLNKLSIKWDYSSYSDFT